MNWNSHEFIWLDWTIPVSYTHLLPDFIPAFGMQNRKLHKV